MLEVRRKIRHEWLTIHHKWDAFNVFMGLLLVCRTCNNKNVNICTNERKEGNQKIKQRTDTRIFYRVR